MVASSAKMRCTYCLKGLAVGVSLLLGAGCGGKGSTDFKYRGPEVAPIGISFTKAEDGLWKASAGIVTSVGTFSIERTFDYRDEFTYIVLRNRDKGVDQIFKVSTSGYVDVHAVGDHRLRIQREGNQWIIDTQTISGHLDINVYPSSSAIARVDFGDNDIAMIVHSDRKIIIEQPSRFFQSKAIQIDSIKSIGLHTQAIFGVNVLSFDPKPGVPEPTYVYQLTPSAGPSLEHNLAIVESTPSRFAPHVHIYRRTSYVLAMNFIFASIGAIAVSALLGAFVGYTNFRDSSFKEQYKNTWFWQRPQQQTSFIVDIMSLCGYLFFMMLIISILFFVGMAIAGGAAFLLLMPLPPVCMVIWWFSTKYGSGYAQKYLSAKPS